LGGVRGGALGAGAKGDLFTSRGGGLKKKGGGPGAKRGLGGGGGGGGGGAWGGERGASGGYSPRSEAEWERLDRESG